MPIFTRSLRNTPRTSCVALTQLTSASTLALTAACRGPFEHNSPPEEQSTTIDRRHDNTTMFDNLFERLTNSIDKARTTARTTASNTDYKSVAATAYSSWMAFSLLGVAVSVARITAKTLAYVAYGTSKILSGIHTVLMTTDKAMLRQRPFTGTYRIVRGTAPRTVGSVLKRVAAPLTVILGVGYVASKAMQRINFSTIYARIRNDGDTEDTDPVRVHVDGTDIIDAEATQEAKNGDEAAADQ